MDALWEIVQEFASTLVTLLRAQVVLIPLIASWIFTVMWVYATERRRRGRARSGRAFLGLFWLPGLLVYYFSSKDTQVQSQGQTFTGKRTPKTVRAEDVKRDQHASDVTFDGVQTVDTVSRVRQGQQKTDDGSMPGVLVRPSVTVVKATPSPFILEVLNGSMKGQKLQAPAGAREVGIGSRNNNQIQLQSSKVAPWHVVVKYERTGAWVLRVVEPSVTQSAKKGNGKAVYETKVNGKVVKMKLLEHRDEIQLGDVRLRFHCS